MTSTETTTYGLGELARAADLPIGTVKYYLREGLLPQGRLRSPTRADYGPAHLERLRLLRLLREVGAVPVDRLRDLVTALADGDETGRLTLLAAGSSALAGTVAGHRADGRTRRGPGRRAGRHRRLDRCCCAGAPSGRRCAGVLETVLGWEDLGLPVRSADLAPYVEAADHVARHDVAALDDAEPTALLTQLVVGQVVYGRLLEVLRRLGEAHHSIQRYGPGTD